MRGLVDRRRDRSRRGRGAARLAAVAGGDHSGESVRASSWADDVCGTVGAWEGQLEAIGDDVELNNIGARQNDGGSGDHVEGVPYVRSAIDRVIDATDQTLQEGLTRAGMPDTATATSPHAPSLPGRRRRRTSSSPSRKTSRTTRTPRPPPSPALGEAVQVLERSAIAGREVFELVAGLEPELDDAFDGSGECRRLMDEEP